MDETTVREQSAKPPPAPHTAVPLSVLDFRLPPFTRVSWTSDAARATWEPRMRRILAAWRDIEWQSVAEGVRACGTLSMAHEDLPEQQIALAERGLSVWTLELQTTEPYPVDEAHPVTRLGASFQFRAIVGTAEELARFHAAWEADDGAQLASLLGQPACCARFAGDTASFVDATWPTARNGAHRARAAQTIECSSARELNLLWRWLGLRCVPHMPCRFDCAPSAALAARLLELGRRAGHAEALDWLLEILDWPVEWSCLHGIAEIRTPILKIAANSDATPTKFIVRRHGQSFPAEGARGLTFAYRAPEQMRMTESEPYLRGLANPIRTLPAKLT